TLRAAVGRSRPDLCGPGGSALPLPAGEVQKGKVHPRPDLPGSAFGRLGGGAVRDGNLPIDQTPAREGPALVVVQAPAAASVVLLFSGPGVRPDIDPPGDLLPLRYSNLRQRPQLAGPANAKERPGLHAERQRLYALGEP